MYLNYTKYTSLLFGIFMSVCLQASANERPKTIKNPPKNIKSVSNKNNIIPATIKQWKKQAAAVSITRDNWGVPHVYGVTDADAVFGLMYAQCEDDFWNVEETMINKTGRRAELYGEKLVMEDLYSRLFADSLQAKKAYSALPLYYRQLFQAHANALNYYIYKHPEKVRLIREYKPWFLLLSSAPSILSVGFTNAEVYAYLSKQVMDSSRVSFETHKEDDIDGIGSNGWALSPKRTTNGHSFLYINPHGAITGSGQRLEVHVSSKQGLNAYGAPFTGSFTIWQGFNNNFGWARTNQYADMNDLYELNFDHPSNKLAYRYDNTYKRAREKIIAVKYKSGENMQVKHFKTLLTQFGPVIGERDGKLLALKDSTNEALSIREDWDLPKARNYAEFKKVWSIAAEKPCTIVYADIKGRIAYWHANMVPKRDTLFNWTTPISNIGAKTTWKGIHTVDELPHVVDPSTGFIQNSNSIPWTISGPASPDSTKFPNYMSYDARTLRSVLGVRLFDNQSKYSLDSFEHAALKNNYLVRYEIFIPSLLKQFDNFTGNDSMKSVLQAPIEILRRWNYVSDTASVATTLAILLDDKLGPLFDKKLPSFSTSRQRYNFQYSTAEDFADNQALQLLGEVISDLTKDFGSWEISWGKICRLQRISPGTVYDKFDDNKPSIAMGAVQNQTGSLFDFASKKYPGTKLRYGFKGNTFVAVVDFGPRLYARTILTYGQSADPDSPHYFDQAPLYADGKLKEIYFYKEDIDKHTERTYHPGE